MCQSVPPLNKPDDVVLGRAAKAWGLTELEVRVLCEIVCGLGNKDVAEGIGRSVKTVERYATRLFTKSRCSGRSMLAARFWAEFGSGPVGGAAPLAAE